MLGRMEDRITPGLYLEMTDLDPAQYARSRVAEVLALPGVQRATWWENCVPFRDDLPRNLPEFRLLGVYEVDGEFNLPARPDNITIEVTPEQAEGVSRVAGSGSLRLLLRGQPVEQGR